MTAALSTVGLLSTPATAGVVLLVALVVLVLLIVLLLRAGEKSTFADSAPPPPAPEPEEREDRSPRGAGPLALRGSFRRAMARLDRHAAGPEPRYRLPWFLLAGEEGSRPPDALGRAGLPLPFGPPAETGLPTSRRADWWFLERGVVLDLGGAYFEAEGGSRFGAGGGATGLDPVLRLLQRSRPRRPLDGVVLTVSAAELHRAGRAGTAGRSRLEERAGRVCRALWRAQRRLGLTLPVYVVVTDCDVVPGFGDFARALPERRRREMVGWSSPYAVDTAYRGEWVDETFAALAHRLDQIQGEIFTDRAAGASPGGGAAGVDPDRVFVFPHAFATLARPLRAYLDPIFRPSSYHESLILRGVYFSGALGDAEGAPVLFLRDVLESKAFPEAGLGGPLPATLVARNRRLATLQAAVVAGALILGSGLWFAHARLERSKVALEPALDQIATHVRQARIEKASPDGVDPDDVERWTEHLFGSMAAIDIDRFASPFLPSSWVSPFNRRLQSAIVEAYEEVVFESMSQELDQRADDLTRDFGTLGIIGPAGGFRGGASGGSVDPLSAGAVSAWDDGGEVLPLYPVGSDSAGGGSTAPLVEVTDTPEFEELRSYVASLVELESVGDVYNRLDESRDLSDLARVLDYLYDMTVPAEFFDHDALYREAQSRATHRPFAPSRFRDQAAARAETLAARLNRRLFADNELLASLEVTTTGVRQLAGASWPSANESWRVRAVAEELRRVEDLLAHPGAAWAFQPSFDLGPGFRQVLAHIEGSAFLGSDVADRVRRAAEVEWISYRRRLTGYSTELTGPLLALEQGQPRLSPDLLLLQSNLDRFLGQSFAADTEPVWLATEMPPGADLDWDLDLLRRAIALYEPYQRFRENTLPLSPPEVRPALDSVARERLGANIVALIAEAQSFEALPEGRSAASLERRLRSRVAAFEAAAEPLSRLLALLDELGLWQAREDLTDLMVQQGGRLLSQADHLLRSRDPYAPLQGGFGWWDGTVPAGLAAFDVANPEELAGYLQLQRQRLEGIARDYAEPLVTWLEQTGAANDPSVRPLVARWDGILAALDAHAGQKPGNSVGRLEEFIGQEIAELTLDGCFAALPARGPARAANGADYFLDSRERLRSELLSRCRALAADRAADSYAELANLFNRRLAGRYPFAENPDAAYTAEAAPEDVEAFFRRFDLGAPLIREAGSAEGASTPGLPRTVLDFVDEMGRVRRFFAPYLDAEEQPPAPLYDVEVEFRVNRAAEVGGSQIIEWALEVGRERITNRSETLRTRWSPGEPVRLTLRWAADSPREPVTPSVPEVRSWSAVEGRTVTYEFRNRWSLLSALDVLRARPRDVEAYAALDPGTLYLAVDTRRTGSERIDPEPAEVYVRLSVLPPDGAESLTVPRFPARAPALRGRGGEAL